ncbi:hypothetical protein ANCDUO_22640, partial [Ancylostoma duodenale]
RKVLATPNTQANSSRDSRRAQQELRTPGGPGYFNPKYHRRSKSAPRVLDHQPTHRVPTGGILRAKLPTNAKHVTKPEAYQLQKSSDYVLTHQEVDEDGNINTSIIKNRLLVHVESMKSLERTCSSAEENTSTTSDADGECIPTAGGGTAVLFNDVEQVSHKSPGRPLRSSRSANRT